MRFIGHLSGNPIDFSQFRHTYAHETSTTRSSLDAWPYCGWTKSCTTQETMECFDFPVNTNKAYGFNHGFKLVRKWISPQVPKTSHPTTTPRLEPAWNPPGTGQVFLGLRICALRRGFEATGMMLAANAPPSFARRELQRPGRNRANRGGRFFFVFLELVLGGGGGGGERGGGASLSLGELFCCFVLFFCISDATGSLALHGGNMSLGGLFVSQTRGFHSYSSMC